MTPRGSALPRKRARKISGPRRETTTPAINNLMSSIEVSATPKRGTKFDARTLLSKIETGKSTQDYPVARIRLFTG